MKAVGAFNADFVQVIPLVYTRYSVLMDYCAGEITVLLCTMCKTIFLVTKLTLESNYA